MRFRPWLIGLIVIALVIGVCAYFTRKSQRLAYHLARFNALKTESKNLQNATGQRRTPSTLRDYFRPVIIRWYLRGKPSLTDEWLAEEQALVDLGYFQRRELILTNRQAPLNPSTAQLDPEVRKAFFGGINSPWYIYMDTQRPSWVRVTGTNLDIFEQIVRRWDSQGTR